MNEQMKFLARVGEARDAGLVDVKFFFHPARAVNAEDIFASLNSIGHAVESGKCVRHSNWDDDDQPLV